MTDINVSVVYYSATGTAYAMARTVAEAAEAAGAAVRLRKVREQAPPEAINSDAAWAEHADATGSVAEATLEDLSWADAVVFESPTRFSNAAGQLKSFPDTAGPLWHQGALEGKVYSAFTASGTLHDEQESTLLALSNIYDHWGGIIEPPGYTDPIQFQTGNAYGGSYTSTAPLSNATHASLRHQAGRVVETSRSLKRGRVTKSRGALVGSS